MKMIIIIIIKQKLCFVIMKTSIDIAIIGAGPQALTLVMHLLQKKKTMKKRFMVFDPSGGWMHQWHHQFSAFQIAHLRSPSAHHPHPNPQALRTFGEHRPHEFFPPYDLPGTQLFQDFCQDLIQNWQLQDTVYPARVLSLTPIQRKFQLHLSTGETFTARRVVLAIGAGKPIIPDWAKQVSSIHLRHQLCHSSQIDLRNLSLRGERILIVGGGLTSGHLALGASQLGATVILMARRDFQEKLFDTDPGWLGPKYLKGFWAETDWYQRFQLLQTARNGGSMTPSVMTKLRQQQHQGKVILSPYCEVKQAVWEGSYWHVDCNNGQCLNVDRIWLGTGHETNVEENPLLSSIREAYPIEVINGLPILDSHLRWPGCELFMMGAWAGLQVGPVARNLAGARMASHLIVPALTKSTVAYS